MTRPVDGDGVAVPEQGDGGGRGHGDRERDADSAPTRPAHHPGSPGSGPVATGYAAVLQSLRLARSAWNFGEGLQIVE